MEEISGRADGADETRIDEFTTEVAQEEICDGADCADGFTTVAQEEISGADKTLRVDDFTTVAQEEISGRADGADGSTTEVAQEVSGRAEGADETRMDEFTTVAQFLDHLSNTWLPHFQASNSSGTSSGQDDRPDHLGLCDLPCHVSMSMIDPSMIFNSMIYFVVQLDCDCDAIEVTCSWILDPDLWPWPWP